jgi:hypothetical protein
VAPQGTDLVLSTDIPDGEGDVLVLDSLDVEAYSEQIYGNISVRNVASAEDKDR